MKLVSRVVFMEDEVQTRRLYKQLIEREGLDVQIARSLRELRRLTRGEVFDAAILDIRMSKHGLEGFTAIVELREMFPDMYIEVITAFPEHRQRALGLGADLVLVKPEHVTEKNPGDFCREFHIASQSVSRKILGHAAHLL